MTEERLRKIRYLIIILASIVMFSMAIGNYAIWADEQFTLNVVHQSWSKGFRLMIHDRVHPPLYYLVLKLFLSITGLIHIPEIPSAKLFSIFWIILFIAVGSKMLSERYGERTALLFTLFLCGTETVGYSVEIRMYSMALCLCGLAWLHADEWEKTKEQKEWNLYCLDTILAAYTHYFAILSLAVIWFWILHDCRKNGKAGKWVCSLLLLLILYVPWIIAVMCVHESVTDYTSALTLWNVINLFFLPFSVHNSVISSLVILFTGLLFLWIIRFHTWNAYTLLAMINPFILGAACLILSFVVQKFFSGRYLLPGWGAMWAGTAIALRDERFPYRKAMAVLTVLDVLSLGSIWKVEYNDKVNGDRLLDLIQNTDAEICADDSMWKILDCYQLKKEILPISEMNEAGYYITDELLLDESPDQVLDFAVGNVYVYCLKG